MPPSNPLRRDTSAKLSNRLMRAARLDPSLYGEVVGAGARATGQALALVALVAVAHGTAGMIRSVSFGRGDPMTGALFGVVGEIAFFTIASLVVYLLGRFVFGAKVTYGRVMRPLGFSVVPGLLILVAALASLPGVDAAEVLVFVVLIAWRLAASYVAVREGLGLGRPKSAVVLAAGVICGMGAVVIATRILFDVLRLVAVSGSCPPTLSAQG